MAFARSAGRLIATGVGRADAEFSTAVGDVSVVEVAGLPVPTVGITRADVLATGVGAVSNCVPDANAVWVCVPDCGAGAGVGAVVGAEATVANAGAAPVAAGVDRAIGPNVAGAGAGVDAGGGCTAGAACRSEEHTSELQ